MNTVIIGPHTTRLLALMGLCTICVMLGMSVTLLAILGLRWMLDEGWVIIAIIGALVACSIVALAVATAVRRRPRIEIGADGFVALSLFGSRSRRWADIEGDFVLIKVGMTKVVAYRLTDTCKKSAGIKSRSFLQGNDEGISGAYRLRIEEVTELLNQHLAHARAPSSS